MPKKWQIIVCTHESRPIPRGLLHYTTFIKKKIVGPHNLGEGGNSSCTLSSCMLVYIVTHPIKLRMVCNSIYLWTLITKISENICKLSHVAQNTSLLSWVMTSLQIPSPWVKARIQHPTQSWYTLFNERRRLLKFLLRGRGKTFSPQDDPQ